MSALKNDASRFNIVNIDPDSPSRGPFIIAQNGSSPDDPQLIIMIYLLTKSGVWVSWSGLLGLAVSMADEVLFDTVQEVVKCIESLDNKVVVKDLAVDPAKVIEHIAQIEANGGLHHVITQLLAQRQQSPK